MASFDSLAPTTELDAINVLLLTIGEQPVNSTAESGLSDVAIAKKTLGEESRRVQAKGWDFNTDLDYQLARDVLTNKVPVPTNTLRIDTSRGDELVARGGFFWDRVNNTFVLTDSVYADIVRYLPFEDLPESARYYITLKAARVFQRRMQGDDAVELFTEKDESEARADFLDSEQSSADRNMMRDAELNGIVRDGRNQTSFINIV